jgi:ABC-type uncharacterized transport system auxiliary subunit
MNNEGDGGVFMVCSDKRRISLMVTLVAAICMISMLLVGCASEVKETKPPTTQTDTAAQTAGDAANKDLHKLKKANPKADQAL